MTSNSSIPFQIRSCSPEFSKELSLASNEHALIGVSPFNSYFSSENMEKLFLWAQENFINFHIFTMDEASVYNLIAMGYDEKEAIRKTRSSDNNLKNKVIRNLVKVGFNLETSQQKILLITRLHKNEKYKRIYNKCIKFFEENLSFRKDCLEITRVMIADKVQHLTEDKLYLAVRYLLEELPVWLDTPYILNIKSSVFVYKDFSHYWQKVCYDYGLMSKNQSIFVKNVT